MAIKIDGSNVAEQVLAGTALLAIGAAGAVAYEHRHKVKSHMRKLKHHVKKKLKR